MGSFRPGIKLVGNVVWLSSLILRASCSFSEASGFCRQVYVYICHVILKYHHSSHPIINNSSFSPSFLSCHFAGKLWRGKPGVGSNGTLLGLQTLGLWHTFLKQWQVLWKDNTLWCQCCFCKRKPMLLVLGEKPLLWKFCMWTLTEDGSERQNRTHLPLAILSHK